jgi:LuxR family maltose regulon positive regulatory protein
MGEESGIPDPHSTEAMIIDQDQYRELPASIANARAYHAQATGNDQATLKYARQALDLLPENEHLKRGISAVLIGFVQWQEGDLEAAFQSFTDVRNSFQKAGEISTVIGITFIFGDIRITQGRIQDALNIYKKSMQLAINQGEPLPFGTEDLYRGLSELYLEMGEMDISQKQMQKGEQLYEKTRLTDWRYRRYLAQAKMREAEGDLGGALHLIEKAQELYFRSPLPDIRPVAALRARLWIKQGKLDMALDWVISRGLTADDELNLLQEFEHLVHCQRPWSVKTRQ